MSSLVTRRNTIALTAVTGAGALVFGVAAAQTPSTAASAETIASSSPRAVAAFATPAGTPTAITRGATRPAVAVTPTPAAKPSVAATPAVKATPATPAVKAAAKATPAKPATKATPKPSAKATPTAAPTSDLSTSQMRLVQAELTVAGYSVPRTGHFGTMTQDAIRSFQKANGLDQTGGPGPRTLSKLSAYETRAKTLLAKDSGTTTTQAASSSTTSTTAKKTSSTSTATSAGAQAAVAFAYAQLGKPYVYGATGPSGYDCSGLTGAAWKAAGVSIPRTSGAQWSGLRSVSTSNLRPGDIVVYYGGGHVGLYVGNGMIIHAPRPGKSVEKVSLNTMPISGAVRPA